MSLHRVDPRFALPRAVSRAVVLGGLQPWIEGLREAGVEVAEQPAAGAAPELVVAPAGAAADAISTRAQMIVLEGLGGVQPLRRAGLRTQRLIPIPSLEGPRHLVRPDHPRAAVYAFERWSIPKTAGRRLRNVAVKSLLARGIFPDRRPSLAVGLQTDGAPFLLPPATELGVPREVEWFMTLGGFDALSRSVFYLFAPGEPEPGWVVKFARIPGYTEPFELDERGVRLALAAGESVSRRVPRILGRFEVEGLHASVEIAASGYGLTDFLERNVPQSDKLGAIDSVAEWILELGTTTARDGAALEPERTRLVNDVVPHWSDAGILPSLVEGIPPIPGVLQHANLGAWNVITRGPGDFAVIDWETVREGGFPLWDLLVFLHDALLKLDGASGQEVRDEHAARLFRGELPSSEILFRWIRAAVGALSLPPTAVGPLATLCWLDRGMAVASRQAARNALDVGGAWASTSAERFARMWIVDPGLGPGWDAWQRN
jgi:hypothetical protein